MGGSICLWYLHVFSMHWYFLISSYYLTVSNGCSLTILKSIEVTQHSGSFEWGGSICLWYLHLFSMCWYFLISSYYLTVSNGRSLTALKSIEVTPCSGSFEWGVRQIYPKSAKFELTCRLMLCFTEGLFVLHTKDLIRQAVFAKGRLFIHTNYYRHTIRRSDEVLGIKLSNKQLYQTRVTKST